MAASKVAYLEDEDADVPDHLLCPICFCLPREKIYQCNEGHVVCSKCYNNKDLLKCPQCPFKFKVGRPIRNRYFEAQAAEYVKVDCTFKSNGCTQRTRRSLLNDHGQGCRFNYKKYGNPINLCKLMEQDCNFLFNNGNAEDAVVHFKFAHGAIITKDENIRMEIPSFNKDMEISPTSGNFQFWNPVIVELPEENCYIFCVAVRNVKEDSFKCISLFLPRFNASLSKPSDLKMECSLIDESQNVPLKLSIVQDLTSVHEFLQGGQGLHGLFSEGGRPFEMSEVKNFIKDGILLIGCRLMKGKDMEKESWSVICEKIMPSSSRRAFKRIHLTTAKFVTSARWNPFDGSLDARKYLKNLKTGLTLSSNNPKAMETIQTICDGVTYQNNRFWEMFDGISLMHIVYGALFIVASSGTFETLEQMLSLGSLNVNIVDEIGKSLLHYTMDDKNQHRGFMKAKRLLVAGVNIKAVDDNHRSLLHWAACSGNAKAIPYFVYQRRGRNFIDVNLVDAEGRTPLHYALMNATEWGTRNVVEVLMQCGASEYVKDNLGRTPLDYLGEVKGSMTGKMIDEIMKFFNVVPLRNQGITNSWGNDKANDWKDDEDDEW